MAARDDGRTLTADEWKAVWGEEDEEPEGECYVLPKVYPGPRIRCPNCGYWQVCGTAICIVGKSGGT